MNVKKCSSIIWPQDLNPSPSDYESPPLNSRPRLLPKSRRRRLWRSLSHGFESSIRSRNIPGKKLCCRDHNGKPEIIRENIKYEGFNKANMLKTFFNQGYNKKFKANSHNVKITALSILQTLMQFCFLNRLSAYSSCQVKKFPRY